MLRPSSPSAAARDDKQHSARGMSSGGWRSAPRDLPVALPSPKTVDLAVVTRTLPDIAKGDTIFLLKRGLTAAKAFSLQLTAAYAESADKKLDDLLRHPRHPRNPRSNLGRGASIIIAGSAAIQDQRPRMGERAFEVRLPAMRSLLRRKASPG